MGKIFCLMGKSACGKDTLYKRIITDKSLSIQTLIPYTTRPPRSGERNGVEYFFLSEQEQLQLEQQGKIIELRAYQTVQGVWKYFTVNDHQINLAQNDYLIIGTLESYLKLQNYFGADSLVPLYIELDNEERMRRAITREQMQKNPDYEELCRRFLADLEDFSPQHLEDAGIKRSFINDDIVHCTLELTAYIKQNIIAGSVNDA
ncbi:guanylate kinase [Lachnospiraceae bacterium 66-29]